MLTEQNKSLVEQKMLGWTVPSECPIQNKVSGNTFTQRVGRAEIGRVEEKMSISKNNNEDIKISFSAKYMMEALKSFSTETVDLHFVGEVKPILIKSTEDETLTQLVLPIRTY